jgi:hypothetical protein
VTEKMTREQAIAFYEARAWEPMTHRERAAFQLHHGRSCMPFSVFHEAVEKTLGRPVFTHEFGLNWDGLIAELNGAPAPTFAEILARLPADKTIVVEVKP